MTLKPTDMLEIQSAIDAYERKFPGRPAPSAAAALEWRLGKREWTRRLARHPELSPEVQQNPAETLAEQKHHQLVWVWQRFRIKWQMPRHSQDGLVPVARRAWVVGWWGMVMVLIASVFFIGALVGGYK